jgi:hypothetical protein
MIDRIRFIWQLLVLASILALFGMILIPRIHLEMSSTLFLVTLASVGLVNLITYMIMYTGIQKSNREGVVVLLGGIGTKFLLYLLFLLLIWIVTKNLSKAFILTFFALYLFFTFFTAGHLLKLLKNK